MPNPKQTGPQDVAVAAIAQAYIAQAYEELGRSDEQFAFMDERAFA